VERNATVGVVLLGVEGVELFSSHAEELAAPGEPAADEPAAEQLPWRGSIFIFEQDLSTATFDRSAGRTYNPYYSWVFTFMPRWYFTDEIYLRLRQDMDVELTDADDRTYQNELWFADTRFDLGHSKIAEFGGATLAGAARIRLPLSKTSQAYDRILGAGFGVALDRPIEDVLEGFNVGAALGYDHYFATSNVTTTDETFPCAPASAENIASGRTASSGCSQTGGGGTVVDSLTFGITADVTLVENVTLAGSFTWWWTRAHGLADAVVPVATAPGGAITLEDGSETHGRHTTWFTFEAGYAFSDWINAALGVSTLTSQLNPDGSRRNPFANLDSQLYLTANITLDKLYGALSDPAPTPSPAPIAGSDDDGTDL
jgi:hypothetical protein